MAAMTLFYSATWRVKTNRLPRAHAAYTPVPDL